MAIVRVCRNGVSVTVAYHVFVQQQKLKTPDSKTSARVKTVKHQPDL